MIWDTIYSHYDVTVMTSVMSSHHLPNMVCNRCGWDKMSIILQTIFSNRCDLIQFLLKSVPINTTWALVQVMAWHQTGHKPLPEATMTKSTNASIGLNELNHAMLKARHKNCTYSCLICVYFDSAIQPFLYWHSSEQVRQESVWCDLVSLTHWPLEDLKEILFKQIEADFHDW